MRPNHICHGIGCLASVGLVVTIVPRPLPGVQGALMPGKTGRAG